jgi:fibro-slime domain-containing protein
LSFLASRFPTLALTTTVCGLGTHNLACGSRTDLPLRTTCSVEGERSPCEDACGEGWVECENGVWSTCRHDETTEACDDACGVGVRRCEQGQWGACEVPRVELACSSKCGQGVEICEAGVWSACDAPVPLPPALRVRVRDFNDTHPDFERPWDEILSREPELGILDNELGPDDKPIFVGPAWSITSASTFSQWYRDVPGVNLGEDLELPLIVHPLQEGFYFYKDETFFPIDGELFGNQGRVHNYHFTLEAITSFTYRGGEVFRFHGDDDFWVFVNRKLAIDLGGLHPPRAGEVQLDEAASKLGLALGNVYPLHLFFAERHTVASNFIVETTLNDIGPCP